VFNLREKFANVRDDSELDAIGSIMHQGWQVKKTLSSKVSNEGIEKLYKMALDAGAIGGKVAGAGGGGFLLLYVSRDKQDNVRKKLGHLRELPFMFEPDGSKVIFNQRRKLWK
jgi:Predicted kinase related to galactokinase and mevalonate kinase